MKLCQHFYPGGYPIATLAKMLFSLQRLTSILSFKRDTPSIPENKIELILHMCNVAKFFFAKDLTCPDTDTHTRVVCVHRPTHSQIHNKDTRTQTYTQKSTFKHKGCRNAKELLISASYSISLLYVIA